MTVQNYQPDENEILLHEFREGNNRAFYRIHKLHYVSIWHFAHYLIDNKADAEDITATAFLKLYKQCSTFHSIDRIKPFLVVVTRNACFDYLKHNKVKKAAKEELLHLSAISEDDLQANLFKSEILSRAVLEIDALPKRMREIVKMIYLKGLTNTEIAEKLNITESTVRVQKTKAMQTLRVSLMKRGLLASAVSLSLTILYFCL
jgi:RNA polymerase sigma-70 factor (family 1)